MRDAIVSRGGCAVVAAALFAVGVMAESAAREESLEAGFRSPPPGFGEVPFWWWNGDRRSGGAPLLPPALA